jgi:electron transport complex protein RnfC
VSPRGLLINKYKESDIIMSIFSKHLPAVKVGHYKNTENSATEKMPLPDKVFISMVQHIGAPCQPRVKVGDMVKVGQVIGDTDAFVSAPIHSSVSGKVTAIDQNMTMMGIWDPVVTIELDKEQELIEDLKAPKITDRESFIKAVRDSGLVGLGGAAFPTHVKFSPKNLDEVDTLIINGAECEPYITSDYRTMMEDTDLLVEGIKRTKEYLSIKRVVVAIELNKAPAIEKLSEAFKDSDGIEVMGLKPIYPQGAEKVLIYEVTGRQVPIGKLPADVGVLVSNVSSIVALEKYVQTGIPLITRKVTVDGTAVNTPKNVEVLIGTSIKDLIEFCGGYKKPPKKILMGGPMMGRTIYNDNMAIIKNNNAILAFDEDWVKLPKETACINCGRCVRTCPMRLMPTLILKAYDKNDVDELKKLNVLSCMECGTCTYVCPAKKQLSFVNKLAKQKVMEGGNK